MTTGNIDQPAICKECGVTTTLDTVQQICWECWIKIEDTHLEECESPDDEEMVRDHLANYLNEEE